MNKPRRRHIFSYKMFSIAISKSIGIMITSASKKEHPMRSKQQISGRATSTPWTKTSLTKTSFIWNQFKIIKPGSTRNLKITIRIMSQFINRIQSCQCWTISNLEAQITIIHRHKSESRCSRMRIFSATKVNSRQITTESKFDQANQHIATWKDRLAPHYKHKPWVSVTKLWRRTQARRSSPKLDNWNELIDKEINLILIIWYSD